ncbi:unnamed protein product [Chrysoparadoxa australica]
MTAEAEAMWSQLSTMALQDGHINIAERCAAALGDVARARYLHKICKINAPGDHWEVRHKLCLLNQDVRGAEHVLVAQGKINEALEMHNTLHAYEEAINLARNRKLPEEEIQDMSMRCYQLLLDTNQDQRAALLKEQEGAFEQAIKLYLKGGLPAQAARVLAEQKVQGHTDWLETVASALSAAGMHQKAGELYEEMDQLQRAMDSFVKGHAFRKAVDLARRSFPSDVVSLQEDWGDWLVSQKQVDMAINHYIEARASTKAIEAALTSRRQWSKAAQLVETVDRASAKPYYKQLARHYEEASQYSQAEKFFVEGDVPELAVEMYTQANLWESAHRLATSYMSEGEVRMLYIDQANKMEKAARLKDAEKLYLQVDEVDLAITMYKKLRKFDDMVRLVGKYRRELLKETHQFLAQQLEMEGALKDAEKHYTEAGEWLSAINMYRSNDMWDEALRVAKLHGGANAQKRVAYAWALALGGEAGAKLLQKKGLIEAAVDYATESGAFDHAFELANAACTSKLPDVHLKHALYLEDEERFKEAEEQFIAAGKPREAIDMFIHQKDWGSAMGVAECHDPAAVGDVLAAQATDAAAARDYAKAEGLYLQASQPDKALEMYQGNGLWQDALRVCQRHLPHKVNEVQLRYQAAQAATGKGGHKSDYLSSGRAFEQQREWSKAVDAYLQANKGVIQGADDLEEIWERAVLGIHVPSRLAGASPHLSLTQQVSRRLCEISKVDAAAHMLREAGQADEAIEVAMKGNAWDTARELAKAEGRPDVQQQVERAYERHLVKGQASDELLELGQTNAALDILAQRGDWDRLWEMGEKERLPPSVMSKYSVLRVVGILEEGGGVRGLREAVETLSRHGAPLPTARDALEMYEDITRAVLGQKIAPGVDADELALVVKLRQVLYDLLQAIAEAASGPKGELMASAIEHLLMSCHYAAILGQCKAQGGKDCLELAAKTSVTLLRYCDIIPADKCFHTAGSLARELGSHTLAFVLLNRYVDLTEAIDEGDATLIDNSDFADATNVPLTGNSTLPKEQYLGEDQREEVRDWVLSVCTDSSIEQTLPPQHESNGTLFAGLYASDLPSCIVTGYPVHKKNLLEINQSRANKRDWNAFVRIFKKCPWTGQTEQPKY